MDRRGASDAPLSLGSLEAPITCELMAFASPQHRLERTPVGALREPHGHPSHFQLDAARSRGRRRTNILSGTPAALPKRLHEDRHGHRLAQSQRRRPQLRRLGEDLRQRLTTAIRLQARVALGHDPPFSSKFSEPLAPRLKPSPR